MGCDIHLYVEKRISGIWFSADEWTQDKYETEPKLEVAYKNRFYSGRNYDLFAILANVRNGSGFAGVKTGDGFNPICMPLGLPPDVTPEVRDDSNRWGDDGHSHSYLTVAELLAYDWTQSTRQQGWLDAASYCKWSGYSKSCGLGPNSYSADVWGGSVEKISNEEMEERVNDVCRKNPDHHRTNEQLVAEKMQSVYTLLEWTETYYQAASDFLSETMPRLMGNRQTGRRENRFLVR